MNKWYWWRAFWPRGFKHFSMRATNIWKWPNPHSFFPGKTARAGLDQKVATGSGLASLWPCSSRAGEWTSVVPTAAEGSWGCPCLSHSLTPCGTHVCPCHCTERALQNPSATEILQTSLPAAKASPASFVTNDSASPLSGSYLYSNFCESKPCQEPWRTTENSEQQSAQQQQPCHHHAHL